MKSLGEAGWFEEPRSVGFFENDEEKIIQRPVLSVHPLNKTNREVINDEELEKQKQLLDEATEIVIE